jgi:hypothetical protein
MEVYCRDIGADINVCMYKSVMYVSVMYASVMHAFTVYEFVMYRSAVYKFCALSNILHTILHCAVPDRVCYRYRCRW